MVGLSAVVALRILGVAPGLPLPALDRLYPAMWVGFSVNAVSGVALIIADPVAMLTNPLFLIKMLLIAAAVVNLVLINRRVLRSPEARAGVVPSGGKRLALAHGDLVHSSWDYRAFRGVVKSRAAAQMARYIPGKLIELYAFGHAKVSRSTDEYRKLNHQELLRSAESWIRRSACDFGVFGHFHVPYAELFTSNPAAAPVGMYSLDCWDRPNILVYEDGVFKRGYLGDNDADHKWSDAKSIGQSLGSGKDWKWVQHGVEKVRPTIGLGLGKLFPRSPGK